MKVHILLANSNKIGGKLIRFFTWSEWNHVAIEIDGSVFDATYDRGVGVSTLKQFKERWEDIQYIEIEMSKPERAREFLLSQRGKSYDWSAIFGFVFRKNWSYRDRWFCSELTFCALSEGGVKIPRQFLNKSHRITPRDIALISMFIKTGEVPVSKIKKMMKVRDGKV